MNSGENNHIVQVLERIVGKESDARFGEPFTTIFATFQGNSEENKAAGCICSLFLSAILEGFPTGKLHTFVHYARENYSCFAFDCRMYEELFGSIPEWALCNVPLIDANGNSCTRECSKQEIFESFDFYTNS